MSKEGLLGITENFSTNFFCEKTVSCGPLLYVDEIPKIYSSLAVHQWKKPTLNKRNKNSSLKITTTSTLKCGLIVI